LEADIFENSGARVRQTHREWNKDFGSKENASQIGLVV